jgi:hypothetical protein
VGGRRRQQLGIFIAGVLSLAAIGAEFEGCGDRDRPADDVPLPSGTTGACLVDAECAPDECNFYTCVAGECMPAGFRFDNDADGEAAAPCGNDCDDTNPRIRPEFLEACDEIDQDCDGAIDEDATGAVYSELADGLVDAQIVELEGTRFAVVGLEEGSLRGYVVEADGLAHAPIDLVEVNPGEEISSFEAAGGEEVVVVFSRAGGPPERVHARRSGDTLVATPPEMLGGTGETKALAIHVFAGQVWIAFDSTVGADTTRWLWRTGAPTLVPLAPSEAGPAIADDGSNVVVLDGEANLSFLSQAGMEVGRQTLTGALGDGEPLASAIGSVLVVHRDAFDYLLTSVTATNVRTPTMAPSGDRIMDDVGIYSVPEGALFTRWGPQGPRVWILAPDLRTVEARLSGTDVSPMGVGPRRVSVANAGGFTVILSSYEGSSVLTFLSCMSSP